MGLLKNGAKIIDIRKQSDNEGYVILAMREETSQPYVTWLADNNLSCIWGHYFEDIGDAVDDFKIRVKKFC